MVKVKVLFDFDNYRLEDLFGHKIMKTYWVDMKIQWSLLTLTSTLVFVSFYLITLLQIYSRHIWKCITKHLICNIDVTAVKNLKCLICIEILNFHENTDKNLERNDKQCWGIYLVSTSFTVVSLLFEAFRYDEFSFLKLHEFSVFEEFLLCLFRFKILKISTYSFLKTTL